MTKNQVLLKWVDEVAQMTKPDKIVWIDGSQEKNDRLFTITSIKGETS